MLQYLKHKINDKMIMGTDSLIQLCTWVDAIYGLQPYLKINTGSGISFGYGMGLCKAIKQKKNKKISTEAKVVGVSDYLPYNIWICLFMEAYIYDIK